ncbi:glycosyltransferase family 2 protein [Desulfosoma sp.]
MLTSVIMPVYNAEKFLNHSIESVLNQSYKQLELILVNDGSTDSSLAVCQHYKALDPRVCIISQPNKGPAAARNTGVRQASGEWIFFLDADDLLHPHALEKLLNACEGHSPDMVLSNFKKLNPDGSFTNQNATLKPKSPPCTAHEVLLGRREIVEFVRHFLYSPSNHLMSYCWARLYKTAIIRQNHIVAREDMRLFEDLVFNLDYLRHVENIFFVNEPLYGYRMHNTHISLSMSIFDSHRLIEDMHVFREALQTFFRACGISGQAFNQLDKDIGHALTHYAIIFLVRSCRLLSHHTFDRLYRHIRILLKAPITQGSLVNYSPRGKNSRWLPWLMRRQWVLPLMVCAMFKGYFRYGFPYLSHGTANR